jgi:hypothetical protein
MKAVEIIVTAALAEDPDISETAVLALRVPDHFSAGHACREALQRLAAVARPAGDGDE